MSKLQVVLDVECYPNFFYIGMMDMETGKTRGFTYDKYNLKGAEDFQDFVRGEDVEFITFNGEHYDWPLIMLAMRGVTPAGLKRASDDIIKNHLQSWTFNRKYGTEPYELLGVKHIDLIEVAPSMCSLKVYGGRMHTKKLQDLPIEPDVVLNEQQKSDIKLYCRNDLELTRELARSLAPQIELRRTMSDEYEVNLMAKSDAQISEAVLRIEYQRRNGRLPPKVNVRYTNFHYEPPTYIKFRTENLQHVFAQTFMGNMELNPITGHVKMPKSIGSCPVKVGDTEYKIGIGGLHSKEKEIAHVATDDCLISDFDVDSYYPQLMLNSGMAPPSFGDTFAPVYNNILENRLLAKKNNDKVTNDTLKIVLNGCFGKTSNQYSTLYSPKMMINTTLTGQLSLLMLIEALEGYGVPVVSANTDGIVTKYHPDKREGLLKIISKWQKHCGLTMSETQYSGLFSRDVNNYFAIKTDGSVKGKGAYGSEGLMKNPQNTICTEAVIEYLKNGTSYGETVRSCTDIKKFVTIRTVKGGAAKEGYVLGKAIRWYYAKGTEGFIHYKENGNIVPRSMGAKPLMDLPDTLPTDIDYKWYIEECREILMSVGAIDRPITAPMPRKNSKAWKALKETGQIKAGKMPKDKWVWV